MADTREDILFGGAAGGGKSYAMLAAAAQFVEIPGYSAILLRKTYQDLALPKALIPVSHEWWSRTAARWDNSQKRWTFPSGATVTFGYLDAPYDHLRYQGSEFQFVGIDELTQHKEVQARYLGSRLRRESSGPTSWVPIRFRSTSNPGGPGHAWVKQRYLESRDADRGFIPSLLDDNPHLDVDQYRRQLMGLDPITRERLLRGDWDVTEGGSVFHREWFQVIDSPRELGSTVIRQVRYWDFAATKPSASKADDPDWTAGCKIGINQNDQIIITDLRRWRKNPAETERRVLAAAKMDGIGVVQWIEEEPGSSGKAQVSHYARNVLRGYPVKGHRETGAKAERAGPLASMAEAGNVYVLSRPWTVDMLDELHGFPTLPHDDQVDAASGAFARIVGSGGGAEMMRALARAREKQHDGGDATTLAEPDRAETPLWQS